MQRSENDEYNARSRLVSLVYDVIRDMKMPADGVTDVEILSLISQAFLAKATAPAEPELPKAHGSKPVSMFSRDVGTLARRQVQLS
jgi:hypothetical protein